MDIAKRFHQNPLLKPSDLQPGIEGMEITCFLNRRIPLRRKNLVITAGSRTPRTETGSD